MPPHRVKEKKLSFFLKFFKSMAAIFVLWFSKFRYCGSAALLPEQCLRVYKTFGLCSGLGVKYNSHSIS